MQVSDVNDVKIYNLTAGKSLPEWLSDHKRRALQKKDVDIRRRIELIQDFDMPVLSNSIRVSRDGDYILATGVYKPRVKCFDVNNLSLKFERCFDHEAITFEVLSDDYSKLVFLQDQRYVEFHAAYGRHFTLRIPKEGRDMKYHYPSCDLYIVGSSSDIYRINLERGQFMPPYTSTASAINKCAINPEHHLFVCGTEEGKVEAWDPRSKTLVGTLDCAFSCVTENKVLKGFPSITALEFHKSLTLGVGTKTGQILLYDIRINRPIYMKDHMNDTAIKDLHFHSNQNLIFSMDNEIVKIWDRNNGKLFTSVPKTNANFNNLCVVPNTGLFFIANEDRKMKTFYIPSLGPAPKWASFLDSLTEELEESNIEIIYDDYKFVTKQELENLGLDRFIGTNLLRAYMHGYFMDIRLYKKAKSIANPFEFAEYKKKTIRDKIEKERVNRVQVKQLPKVNKDLALKLMDETRDKKKKTEGSDLLNDDRFKGLFENPDFEIDKNTDEYRLMNPVLSRLDSAKKKEKRKVVETKEEVEEELEGKNSSDESSDDFYGDDDDNESSDDDHTWTQEMKKQHRIIQKEHRARERQEWEEQKKSQEPKLMELHDGAVVKGLHSLKKKTNSAPLGDRLQSEENNVRYLGSLGSREMTFSTNKNKKYKMMEMRNKKHREERKQFARPLKGIKFKHKKTK